MPNERAKTVENAYRPHQSGIGINAVEAASLRRKESRREERLTQDHLDRILPYQDKDCCTD